MENVPRIKVLGEESGLAHILSSKGEVQLVGGCRLSWHKICTQLLKTSLAVTLENVPLVGRVWQMRRVRYSKAIRGREWRGERVCKDHRAGLLLQSCIDPIRRILRN